MNFDLGFQPPAAAAGGPLGPGGAPMQDLEKQLLCPVCLELFSKPVVILPCQHNLCRKCASHVFQSSSSGWQPRASSSVATGGRLRCPSCRHEAVLDRHGVFGLQRNLLVENIIDIYRQQEHSRLLNRKPEQRQQPMCEEHGEEKINIYCLSCQTPTCSMCKVFGRHRDCQVELLSRVHHSQKAELSDGIAALVASNDHIQAVIAQMEEMCCCLEENGRRRREHLADGFSRLTAVLDQRKQELLALITRQQDHRLKRVRSLIGRYGDRLEAAVTLVESTLQSMEEPHMCLFIQNATATLEKMAAMARSWDEERLELDPDGPDGFSLHTEHAADVLRSTAFCPDVGHEEEESEMDSGLRY